MENNVESVTKDSLLLNLSVRSTERSVLKELKYNEGASPTTKSPKETLTADQPEIQIKEATNLANPSPGIGSNNIPSDGSGKATNINECLQSAQIINDTMNNSLGSSTPSQDSTFISTSAMNNRTVVIGSISPNLDEHSETERNAESNLFNATQVIRAEKISEFKVNETVDVDSLEVDAEDLNLSADSLNMKQDDPSTPPDQHLSVDTAEKIFSSRKAPTFSEMFANSAETKPGKWGDSFVVEKIDLSNEKFPKKKSTESSSTFCVNGKAPFMLEDTVVDDFDCQFKQPSVPCSKSSEKQKKDNENFIVLNSNDFDFLQSRGANSVDPENDPRSSLLLRFDPLSRRSILNPTNTKPILQEIDTDKTLTPSGYGDNQLINKPPSNGVLVAVAEDMDGDANGFMNNIRIDKNGDKIISVDGVVVTNKKIDITSVDENIRKKMEEYEATQEILLKRITEKDKAITKTSNVLELYEKAISEALAAKEKLSQTYEKGNEELKTDRDVTHQHLLSLESTFSDLHMKFERNLQYVDQLQEKMNALAEDKSKAEDILKLQELRYDKMKSHTMQQFDIANTKLEQQTRTISLDNTKLKAQIKREEIHKNAVAEELSQKKKENDELAKICDELISGQRN